MGNWFSSLPGAIAQGLIWGIMAIGVYITYRILDIADLTVDGSICTGAAVCTVLIMRNINPWLALLCAFLVGLVAGSITGAFAHRIGYSCYSGRHSDSNGSVVGQSEDSW